MASRLPSKAQVIELLDAEFTRAGYEIEDVVVDASAQVPTITVTADGDTPLDLDVAAELSRRASDLLDDAGVDTRYVLEISSPGVQRPLTAERHFRRNRGRRVVVTRTDGSTAIGRVGAIDDGALLLFVREGCDWRVDRLPLATVMSAIVEVEFTPPSDRERELVHGPVHRQVGVGQASETEAGS